MKIVEIFDRVMVRVERTCARLWLVFQVRLYGVELGQNVQVYGRIKIRNRGTLIFGAGLRLRSGYSNFVGGNHPISLDVFRNGRLIIGDRAALSNCLISAKESVEIGDDVFIGGGSKIFDHDFHPVDSEKRISRHEGKSSPVKIESAAFVGAYVIILKGVTVGERSVIGAGAVLTKSVPAGEIWAGNPAKKIGVVT